MIDKECPGRDLIPCPEEGAAMDRQEMTVEELREYIRTLPDNVIVRITVMEDAYGSKERKNV